MTRRYSTTSVETTLSASVSSSNTSITVGNALALIPTAIGFTAGDTFAIAIDPDTISEEIVWVTAYNTTTNVLTVERGKADTTATSHNTGATIKHVLTGEDLTSLTTKADNAVTKTDVNAKGDLFVGTANDTYSRLAVGTNERRLVADSAETTGLKYVADTTNYAIAAKGDLLAGTAADTLQAVTVGVNGSTLVADSTATPGVAWTGAEIGKNILINGNVVINERGVSTATLTTSAQWAADRFFARRSAGSTGAQYERLSSTSLTAFPNAIRIQRNSTNTATDTLILGQTVETTNTRPLQGKTVTFSFWARKGADYTATSDALLVRVYTGTGTDQSGLGSGYTGTATPISQSATLTTSWQRFSFSATLATDVSQLQATVQYVPVGTASTNDYFDATGFQLEVGSVATPFVLAGGGQQAAELHLCRRYFENWTSSWSYFRYGVGYATGTTTANISLQFKVRKRATPSSIAWGFIALINSANDTSYAVTGLSFNAGTEGCTIYTTASSASFTTGNLIELSANNTSSAYVQWNAEIL